MTTLKTVLRGYERSALVVRGTTTVAEVFSDREPGDQYKTAALIAAAPDLLEALQYALERFECIPEHRDEIGLYRTGARLARAAIAKATGA